MVLTNYPEGQVEELDAPYYPHDVPLTGSRTVPFSRELWIERDDFMEDPPKKFFRLAPGREVRLRYGYLITCTEVVKDAPARSSSCAAPTIRRRAAATRPTDARCRGRSTGSRRVTRSTARCGCTTGCSRCRIPTPCRRGQDFIAALNPESLVVVRGAKIEPSVAADPPGSRYQFERTGYFISDPVDSRAGALVFNRTVTLRDSWAKVKDR